jgi:hypothetical protein
MFAPKTRNQCQCIYMNLITTDDKVSPLLYIRELFETKMCNTLETQRYEYISFIGEDSLKRILDFEQTPIDVEKAKQAVFHFKSTHYHQIKNELTSLNFIKSLFY